MFGFLKVPRGLSGRARASKRFTSHCSSPHTALRAEALEERQLLSAVPLGDAFEVATFEGPAGSSQVVHDAQGNFLVAWVNIGQTPEEFGTFARRYDAAGQPQGDAFLVARDRFVNFAMSDGGEFIAVWSDGVPGGDWSEVVAQRYDAAGTPAGDVFTVNNFTAGAQSSPSVDMDADGDFVVAWTSSRTDPDPDGHDAGIFARRFNADGTPTGDEFRVSDRQRVSRQVSPQVEMNGSGEFAIGWGLEDFGFTFNVQQYDAAGIPRGTVVSPIRDVFRITSFEISLGERGDLITAAQSNSNVIVQRHSADGTPLADPIRFVADLDRFALSQDSAGNFLLARNIGSEARVQRYSAAGVPLEDEIVVGDDSRNVAAFLDDLGQFTVVWDRVLFAKPGEVLARQYVGTSPLTVANVQDAAGVDLLGGQTGRAPINQLVVQFSGAVNTTGGNSGPHSVTNPANWQLRQGVVDISDQIVGIDYADGVATISLAKTVRTAEYELVASDAIQDPDGAALDGNRDDLPGGDFSTTFRAGPLYVSGEPEVVAAGPDQLEDPTAELLEISGRVDVAVAPSGEHVVVWSAAGESQILAQRYNAAGQPLGAAIVVDEQEDPVFNPSVAFDGEGNFVVSWTIFESEIFLKTSIRRYDADGTPRSDAESISGFFPFSFWSSVAADADGNFVVVESDFFGRVLLHRFNAAGARLGAEVEVTRDGGNRPFADVAMNSLGEFVVSWTTNAFLGGEVFARAYSPLGVPRSDAVQVSPTSEGPNFLDGAIDEEGNFVVAWRDGQSMARRFAADGAPLGEPIRVSPFAGESYSVTLRPDGAFDVSWTNAQDQVVYLQQVSPSDERVGPAVRVNGGNLGPFRNLKHVASAMNAAGDLFVAWPDDVILPDRNWGTSPLVQRLVSDGAPLVDLNGGQPGINFTTDHVAGDGPVSAADPGGLFVSSSFAGLVESATVSIDGFLPGDVLAFDTTGTDIVGNFAGGVLTLTGSDTPASYQQVLRSVTFDTTAARPASATVDVTFVVDDGTLSSPLATSEISNFVPGSASVLARRLFYYPGAEDGDQAAADASTIAPDKSAYQPGSGRATFANVSSYEQGINGVVLDLTGVFGELDASDFSFRTGTSNDLGTWTTAPSPTSVSILPGAGQADRVALVWNRDAVKNQWLEVTLAASGRTGLAEPEVFYFGSRIGDSGENGSPVAALTTASDLIAVRRQIGSLATVENPYDFNRDGVITATDEVVARANFGVLRYLDLGASLASSPVRSPGGLGAVAAAVALRSSEPQATGPAAAPESVEQPVPASATPPAAITAAVFADEGELFEPLDDASLSDDESDDRASPEDGSAGVLIAGLG